MFIVIISTSLLVKIGIGVGVTLVGAIWNWATGKKKAERQQLLQDLETQNEELKKIKNYCERALNYTGSGEYSAQESLIYGLSCFLNGGHVFDGETLMDEEFNGCLEKLEECHLQIRGFINDLDETILEIENAISELNSEESTFLEELEDVAEEVGDKLEDGWEAIGDKFEDGLEAIGDFFGL